MNHLTPTEQARLDRLDRKRAKLVEQLDAVNAERSKLLTLARVRKHRSA